MMRLLNRVHHMDIFDLCDSVPDDSIDMILCDLPYGEINKNKRLWGRREGKCGSIREIYKFNADDIEFDINEIVHNFYRVAKSWIYIFCGTAQLGILKTGFSDMGCMTRVGVWHKKNPTPLHAQYIWLSSTEMCVIARKKNAPFNNFYADSVWRYPAGTSKLHPTQKPIALFEYLIRSSTQPGEVVFDPCVGSGTTALAARNTGRNFIVGDSSAEYVNVAIERLAKPYTVPMFDEVIEQEKPEQLGMEW